MADLTVTAAQVAVVRPEQAEVVTLITGVTVTAGQAVYVVAATGKAALADANASAPAPQFKGIALTGGANGQAINVLKKGYVTGFDLSGMNYGAKAYLSDTAGALADAAGTATVTVGQVMMLPDAYSAGTKALYVEANWTAGY